MDCAEFRRLLDEYVDGVLSGEDAAGVLLHAESCPDCERELAVALLIKDELSHLDDGVAVPLAAQAAWRSAVRAERSKGKRTRIFRVAASAAAAVVALVGVYAAFRPGADTKIVPESQAIELSMADTAGESADLEDVYSARSAAARSGAPASGTQIETCSSVEASTADYAGKIDQILSAVEANGGKVLSREESGESGSRSATLVATIPTDAMDEFVGIVGLETDRYENDISSDLAAAVSRVEALKGSIAALSSGNDDANGVIGSLKAELETAQEALTSLRKRVGMACITITVEEE